MAPSNTGENPYQINGCLSVGLAAVSRGRLKKSRGWNGLWLSLMRAMRGMPTARGAAVLLVLQVLARTAVAVTCGPGRYSIDNYYCEDCTPGQYQDQTNQPSCKGEPCVAGKFFEADKQTAPVTCKDCVPGQYQGSTGQPSCYGEPCVAGKFFEHDAQTAPVACKDCVPGQYQNSTGQLSCKDCNTNASANGFGFATCNSACEAFDDTDPIILARAIQFPSGLNGAAIVQGQAVRGGQVL